MSSLISIYFERIAKTTKAFIDSHLCSDFGCLGWKRDKLHPFGEMVSDHQYVFVTTFRSRQKAEKIYMNPFHRMASMEVSDMYEGSLFGLFCLHTAQAAQLKT